ncbi:hypothetical protein RchiOBHm_Chr2g0095021 [Rosa chinensis]|uniref:Uncharacterized protein n=1 Tax=Rosa chinensis TaxID=74649 RepID=A0A2P6RKS1_ROSCH|nr:hypothetical protein RchiOBHm_Chr2g0095021 [Rosa chinensis]
MDIRNKLTYSEGIPFRRHSQFVTVPPASGLRFAVPPRLSLFARLCLSLPLFHRAPPLHCSSSPLQPPAHGFSLCGMDPFHLSLSPRRPFLYSTVTD